VKLRYSLSSLLALCTASVLITALGLALLFVSATVILVFAQTLGGPNADALSASSQAAASPVTGSTPSALDGPNAIIFDGVLTDDHCGPRHDMGSSKSPSECTQECVREGGHYVVVSGEKRYALTGREDLAILAGERVTVAGTLTGDTIKITSITADK